MTSRKVLAWCAESRFVRARSSATSSVRCNPCSAATSPSTLILCEQARTEAFDLMCEHAQQLGANAIVGVRYDATEVMTGLTEVLCYGTAVVASPKRP